MPPAPTSCSSAPTLPAQVYRRLVALCPALELDVAAAGARPSPRWVNAEALAAGGEALDAWLEAEASRIHGRHGSAARPHVVASRALHGYLWSVCLMMSGPWYLQHRVPRVHPRDLRIDLTSGRFRLVPGAFACLPGDPAAALPGVRVLPHEQALRDELRSAVAEHVRPLLTALGPRLRRGARALWGMAGDDLVSGVWHLGRALGEEERAVRAAGELLPGPVAPFPGGADFRRLTGRDGRAQLTRTRLGCCLHYTIRPAETCGTCPRLCDAERLDASGTAPD
ncbi:(2Fe-2S)-binding protein [Actinacidiphila sp. ITFR-21]|uniref:(2Fe-2S)-binding protein n=1 Tax=Actinacidiphila sp. ITFR-21 TaxID=3075199 RepID=UPI0028898FD5|nr:(2Fe-2S)-binding protein [Streptomyces sp. ITFR-21]WNI18977.1 (2Fe-2S)-binding protein [Streptomyces sp. ITFR-21]